MTWTMFKHINYFVILTLLIIIGCSSASERDYERGKAYSQQKKYQEALQLFEQAILRNEKKEVSLKAAVDGSRVSFFEVKDFKKAVWFYEQIILLSKNQEERLDAQKKLALIFFEQLNDYENAVIEINKTIPFIKNDSELYKYKIFLAKSYFYLGNFGQSEMEINDLINKKLSEDDKFQLLTLKANNYLSRKENEKAAQVFKEIFDKNPKRALEENIAMALAVSYEELKDYKKAIQVLESIKPSHPHPDIIEIKIKRLLERQKNQPKGQKK